MYLPFPVDGNVDINSLPIGFNDADADGADCAADVADCTGDDSSAVDSADAGDFLPGDFLPGSVGAAPSAPSATGDTCACADGADCAADDSSAVDSAVDSADAGDFLPGDFLPGFVGAAPSAPSATGDTCVCADGACVDGAGAGPAKIDVNEDETSFCGGNSRGA